jgi:hypothetical protein
MILVSFSEAWVLLLLLILLKEQVLIIPLSAMRKGGWKSSKRVSEMVSGS